MNSSDFVSCQEKLQKKHKSRKKGTLEEFKFSRLGVAENWGAEPLTFPQHSHWKFEFLKCAFFPWFMLLFKFFLTWDEIWRIQQNKISKKSEFWLLIIQICFFKSIKLKLLSKKTLLQHFEFGVYYLNLTQIDLIKKFLASYSNLTMCL